MRYAFRDPHYPTPLCYYKISQNGQGQNMAYSTKNVMGQSHWGAFSSTDYAGRRTINLLGRYTTV